MRRFLLLYITDDRIQRFAEGLVHFDGAVYVRGFYRSVGELFYDLNGLKNALRDDEGINSFHICMFDEVPQ